LNWHSYSNEPLDQYARNVYRHLAERESVLPERVKQMMPYMIRGDWLVNYSTFEGMKQALNGMARRATFDSKMELAIDDLQADHAAFQKDFDLFFPELVIFSKIF